MRVPPTSCPSRSLPLGMSYVIFSASAKWKRGARVQKLLETRNFKMERAGRALNQAQAHFRAGSLQLQGHRATEQVLLGSGAICMGTGNT